VLTQPSVVSFQHTGRGDFRHTVVAPYLELLLENFEASRRYHGSDDRTGNHRGGGFLF
jgi:hypothetical protein